MRLLGWLALGLALHMATSAKILSVLPFAIKSHSILYDRLIKELAKRGHEITYITPIKSKEPTQNIQEIIIPDLKDLAMGNATNTVNMQWVPSWAMLAFMPVVSSMASSKILQEEEIKALIELDKKFDLIFGEPYADEAIIAGFAYKNKAPIVLLNTLMPSVFSNFAVGNPALPSYIPDPFNALITPLNFFERTYTFLFGVWSDAWLRVGIFLSNRVVRANFGDDAPCVGQTLRNTSLVLINHHPVISFARPQTPNTIDVAGMHIYPPKPLPKDLEEYMKKSTNGVVLFSLGSNIRSSDLGEETIKGVLRALGKLKENVLWKFETELDNLPPNVKIAKWLPQSDILAHPNLKLFITHGGLLSTTEAIFRGVPIVGIPVMADQPINMKYTEHAGLGITLNLNALSEQTLYNAATEVLTNPKYREVAKEKSRLLRDTVMTPLETAVWWIEFVLRNKGAHHLRSPAQDLWWFQLHLFDVYAFVLVAGAGILAFDIWIGKIIFKRIFRSKPKGKKETKKAKRESKKKQ